MKCCAVLLSLLVTLAGCPAWAADEIVTGPDRRAEIELRLEELEAQRAEISFTGPQITIGVSMLIVVAGAATCGASFAVCDRYEFGCEDTGFDRTWLLAGMGVILVGVTTAAIGGTVWGLRAQRRNEIDAERKSLMDERHRLANALSRIEVRSPVRNGTQFVTLGLRF